MKKRLICVSAVVLVSGIVYWLCKKGKSNSATSQISDQKVDYENNTKQDDSQDTDVVEKMHQAKNESAQAVYERHMEAGSIMKGAYSNIMENFVEDFSDENKTDAKDENKDDIIASEPVSVMKEINSISDELDELIK